MDSIRNQTRHVLHGSYQQLENDLDTAYKLMVEFERAGEVEHEGLEVALNNARRSFDHWAEVLREQVGLIKSPTTPAAAARDVPM